MKIQIRKWRLSDAERLAEILNNKNIQNNLRDGLPFPYLVKDAEWFISSMLSADETKTFAFAIVVNGVVCGSIGAFRQANIHFKTAEMGYYVEESTWGKGVCSEAVSLLCSYLFSNTDIIRIFAEPFSYNLGSRRVLEKCGFSLEGVLKNNAIKNGKVLDMCMYSLIKE